MVKQFPIKNYQLSMAYDSVIWDLEFGIAGKVKG